MHYDSSVFHTIPNDLSVKCESFARAVTSPKLISKLDEHITTAAQTYKHLLAIAVAADTPARLDNALGALEGLHQFSLTNNNFSEGHYDKSHGGSNKLLWKDHRDAEWLIDSAIRRFLSSRKIKPVCSIAAQKLAGEIIGHFNARNPNSDINYFMRDLAEDYFKEIGKYHAETLPNLAETYLYLVLNPEIPPDLSYALLRRPAVLGIGHETKPKPFFARNTSYWQNVNASWVYPDIKVDVDPRELREKELEQTILDLEAAFEAQQQTTYKLITDNANLRATNVRLEQKLALAESFGIPPTRKNERVLESWEQAAERLLLDPKLFSLNDQEYTRQIISGLRRAAGLRYQRAAEMGNLEANNKLKQIYGDLAEIAKHFDVK